MASRKSIGNLHATVTANATQFVDEFNRAENASKRSAARIDNELDTLKRNVSKKFSVSDLGKGLLQGLGIGSGIAAAQTAANLLVGYWERAAAESKKVEDSTARQLELVKQMITLNETDAQKRDRMQGEMQRLQREYDTARAAPGAGMANLVNNFGLPPGIARLVDSFFGEGESALQLRGEAVQKAAAELQELEKKMQDAEKKAASSAAAESYRALIAEQDRLLDKADRVFNATRTSAEKFTAEMRELDDLAKRSLIDFDTYARRERQLVQQYLTPAATKPAGPDVDALQRIGLITGQPRRDPNDPAQKQVGLLTQIRDLLARLSPAAPIPKMTPIY